MNWMPLFSLISGFRGAETFWTLVVCSHLWFLSYFMHLKKVPRGWECKRQKIERIICSSENKICNLHQAFRSTWLRSDCWYGRNSPGFLKTAGSYQTLWGISGFTNYIPVLSPHSGSWGVFITHSSILAWQIPWIEDPGGLEFMGLQKNWTQLSDSTTIIAGYVATLELFWKHIRNIDHVLPTFIHAK